MKCENVLKQLSWFVDDVTGRDEADRISRHLNECNSCQREFSRLMELRRKLGALEPVDPPEYLRHLIGLQLDSSVRQPWPGRLRNTWEYWWSRIRTTEAMWYMTRILGTATTFVFFLVISAAMSPLYLSFDDQVPPERTAMYETFRELLLKNLGITVEAQKKRSSPTEPQLNALYYLKFGEQNASRTTRDDNLAVAAVVDRSGAAKIQNVLEYPADRSLLAEFNSMLTSARCRPALQNGRAVDGHLVLVFSKITVYD